MNNLNELDQSIATNNASVKLSILLVTYNQEKYIRRTLDSLFCQKFEGIAEIVVADDASRDRTVEIIKEYEIKNNRYIFKYLDSSTNLGITKNYGRAFKACSGEFVAIIEGDDYWVSPYKLQRQMDFLSEHLECDLCSVNYLVYEENRNLFYPRVPITAGHRLVTARDLIADNLVGNFSTCMYRKSGLEQLPEKLFEITSYDWIVNICIASKSLIGFLNETMSVYRLHSSGVWSQVPYMKQLEQQLELIPSYDELTNHVFREDFSALSNRIQGMLNPHRTNSPSEPAVAHVEVIQSTDKSVATDFQREAKIAGSGYASRNNLAGFIEFLPPVILVLIRLLVPPRLKRYIAQNLF
jgi:glycosyltransferase involved in cell wall biosynthesis